MAPLAGALPARVAFGAYPVAGVFGPTTRTPSEQPRGWATTGYAGVADGRDDFRESFRDRRRAT